MPVDIICDNGSLSEGTIRALWAAVLSVTGHADDAVTVQCVSSQEIAGLNKEYRDREGATNVLTFSYGDGSHDVALCLAVAKEEAAGAGVVLAEYEVQLLAHAFGHVCGYSHDSDEAMTEMRGVEEAALRKAGLYTGRLLGEQSEF